MADVAPLVVVCHRILWTVLFLGLVILVRQEWRSIAQTIRNRRKLLLLFSGAVLIALNWLIFIYAVGSGQTLQASRGYFINPLLSIALGMMFLGEKIAASAMGGREHCRAGYSEHGMARHRVTVDSRFARHDFRARLVRKKLEMNSLHALLVETTLLVPLSAGMAGR